jgi:hypothetical protein
MTRRTSKGLDLHAGLPHARQALQNEMGGVPTADQPGVTVWSARYLPPSSPHTPMYPMRIFWVHNNNTHITQQKSDFSRRTAHVDLASREAACLGQLWLPAAPTARLSSNYIGTGG